MRTVFRTTHPTSNGNATLRQYQPLASYLTRLIWLSILPLMAFAVWLAYEHVRMLQIENDEEAGYLARNFATAIDHHLNARIGSLKVMAASPLADDPQLWPLYYKVSQGYRGNFGSHVIFAEADEPRRMLFNTRAPFGAALPPLPTTKGSAAAPRAVATGQAAVGDILFGPVAQQPLIAIAVPLVRQDKVVKLLLATFELRLFQERLEQVALPAGWRLALLDSQGEVIARRRLPEDELADGAEIYRRIDIRLTVAPWSVVLEIPRGSYLAPILSTGLALALGAFAAILIGIGGGLWGTRRLSRAIASLAEPDAAPDHLAITEIDAVRQRIDAVNQRIATFAAAQDRAIEQERRRVAREVHDQMGQVFTALRLIVQSIPGEAYPAGQEAAINHALEMGIASARKITAELRPPLLDDLGLAAALEHYLHEIAQTSGLACSVSLSESEKLCAPQALGLFRIVQEAVTNILRHAGATRIEITGYDGDDSYHLRIEDDGFGFDASNVREEAMGLLNMRERARLMQGGCRIEPRREGGTVVAVSLPLAKNSVGEAS